ncbi:MAG TPA: META domain-containing protein [Thermomicrobiales bacterium]|nr:META domain-containing protein [Thermomicrobiales bacterium]
MDRRNVLKAGIGLTAAYGIATRAGIAFAHDEGTPEATPGAMQGIAPIVWKLASIDGDDDTFTPTAEQVFTVQFMPDGHINIQADCNVGNASYHLDGESLMIMQGITTLVACEDPTASDTFWAALNKVHSWSISTDASDQLKLTFGENDEAMVFDPTLGNVIWHWSEFQSGDGSVVTAKDPSRYTLEFTADGMVQAQVDCNSGRGDAIINGSEIKLVIATTRKLCSEDSQDGDYLNWLMSATSFVIRGNTLNLAPPMDSGIMVFEAVIKDQATPTP